MHHFPSVKTGTKREKIINISKSIVASTTNFVRAWTWMTLKCQGQRWKVSITSLKTWSLIFFDRLTANVGRSRVTWVRIKGHMGQGQPKGQYSKSITPASVCLLLISNGESYFFNRLGLIETPSIDDVWKFSLPTPEEFSNKSTSRERQRQNSHGGFIINTVYNTWERRYGPNHDSLHNVGSMLGMASLPSIFFVAPNWFLKAVCKMFERAIQPHLIMHWTPVKYFLLLLPFASRFNIEILCKTPLPFCIFPHPPPLYIFTYFKKFPISLTLYIFKWNSTCVHIQLMTLPNFHFYRKSELKKNINKLSSNASKLILTAGRFLNVS